MNKILALFILLISLSFSALAQPDKAAVETINGKKYYVHIVKPGNTLYSIHQLYDTSIESLLNENEGLSNDLTLGQKIIIPIKTSDKIHYGKHKVSPGETLYGISRKYNCSVDDLKKLNSNLSDGISPGQEIIVPRKEPDGQSKPSEVIQTDPVLRNNNNNPNKTDTAELDKEAYSVSVKDSIIEHTILPHETLYSIARRYMVSPDSIMAINGMRNARIKKGKILKIPVKQVNYDVVDKDLNDLTKVDSLEIGVEPSEFKEAYNVALMLPLMLDVNDREMKKSLSAGQVREMYKTTKISFDFYQGFLLAADSLANAGMNVNIYVYDTKRDTNAIREIFKKSEFQNMDLVIGPLYRRTIAYTAKLCAKNKIRIVLPFKSDSDVLYQNPYVYKGVASNMTLLDGTVDYLIENHKQHNIILIKPTSASDLALYERVREEFNQKIKGVEGAYNLHIVESGLGSSGGRDLNSIIKKDTTNIIVIPSTNLTFVSGAMGRLNKVMNMNPYSKNMKLVAFGLEEWNKFDDLDLKYRNRMNQHYASYRFLDYNSKNGIKFIRVYRKEYGTDPNLFASQGFDYGMYFLSALHLYGTNFDLAIADHQMELTQNDFQFRTIQMGSGRENQRVCIIKYDDFKLQKLK